MSGEKAVKKDVLDCMRERGRKGRGRWDKERDWQKEREHEKSVRQRDVVGEGESTCSKVRV